MHMYANNFDDYLPPPYAHYKNDKHPDAGGGTNLDDIDSNMLWSRRLLLFAEGKKESGSWKASDYLKYSCPAYATQRAGATGFHQNYTTFDEQLPRRRRMGQQPLCPAEPDRKKRITLLGTAGRSQRRHPVCRLRPSGLEDSIRDVRGKLRDENAPAPFQERQYRNRRRQRPCSRLRSNRHILPRFSQHACR